MFLLLVNAAIFFFLMWRFKRFWPIGPHPCPHSNSVKVTPGGKSGFRKFVGKTGLRHRIKLNWNSINPSQDSLLPPSYFSVVKRDSVMSIDCKLSLLLWKSWLLSCKSDKSFSSIDLFNHSGSYASWLMLAWGYPLLGRLTLPRLIFSCLTWLNSLWITLIMGPFFKR